MASGPSSPSATSLRDSGYSWVSALGGSFHLLRWPGISGGGAGSWSGSSWDSVLRGSPVGEAPQRVQFQLPWWKRLHFRSLHQHGAIWLPFAVWVPLRTSLSSPINPQHQRGSHRLPFGPLNFGGLAGSGGPLKCCAEQSPSQTLPRTWSCPESLTPSPPTHGQHPAPVLLFWLCRVSALAQASLAAEHVLRSRPAACGILFPPPGIEPTPPALEGRLLTTGPPEKSSSLVLTGARSTEPTDPEVWQCHFVCPAWCQSFLRPSALWIHRIARRDKKAFFSDQWKEIEESNRMGKTRDLFKKIIQTLMEKSWNSSIYKQ